MRRAVLLALLLGAILFLTAGASDALDVYFIDVGAGDAILIDYGDWEALLDAGRGYSAQNAELLEVLGAHVDDGVLELGILSHPHADHFGGFEDVFNQYRVREFWRSIDTTPDSSGPTYAGFLSALSAENLSPRLVQRGDSLQTGSITLSVLGPASLKSGSPDDNDNSLVLLLTYGTVHFLFVGDIESYGEAGLRANPRQDGSLVLKVAHHGSDTSTSVPFLDWASPDLAVISTGYATPPALATLESKGVPSLMTSQSGTIRVSTDGSSFECDPPCEMADAPKEPDPSEAASTLLFLEIDPVLATGQGSDATLGAQSLPGATCSITVYYKSGPSSAAGLVSKVADAECNVSWTWRVGSRTAPGTYRIVVDAALCGTEVSAEVWFEVLDAGSPG